MRRDNHTLTVSLCISLMVHGLGLSALAWWVIMTTPPPKVAAIDRRQFLSQMLADEMQQPPKLPPPPKPKSAKPIPHEFKESEDSLRDDSGEAKGVGTANRSTTGDRPMQAHRGTEQADLMKNNPDKFTEDSPLPASAGKTDGDNANTLKSPKAGTYTPDFFAEANTLNDPSQNVPFTPLTDNGKRPMPATASPKPAGAAASGTKTPVANAPIAKTVTPKSDLKEIRGHKAQMSDSESIAYSNDHPGVFSDGKIEGRKGLKVKTTIPRLGYASQVDLQALGGVNAVLGVKVDVDGTVLDVEVLKSSGSANIDEDLKVAVLNGWTLESEKDKDGNPICLYWTIRFE